MPSRTHTEPNPVADRIGLPSYCHTVAGPTSFERAIPFLIFFISVAYLCLFRRYSSLEPDEGIVLQGAQRILNGEVPYRDFFSFYTPGSFYLLALLFKVFGNTFAVARTSLAVVGAVCTVVTYLLARRVCSRGIALFAAGLATITGPAFRFLVLHNWYSTLLSCAALYAAVRLVECRRAAWAFVTGSLVSLTIIFEQSKGGALCLGLVLGFLTLRLAGRMCLFRRDDSFALAFGFLWPLLITFVYFGSQHSLAIMLQDWLWPLRHYTQANHVPYGWQNWSDQARETIFYTGPAWIRVLKFVVVTPGLLVPVLPLIAVGLFGYCTFQMRTHESPQDKSRYYVLVCAVMSGLLISVLIVRADIIHFMYLTPLWYVVLAWILGSPDFRSQALGRARRWLLAYIGIAFGLMGFAVLLTTTGARNQIETRKGLIATGKKDTVIDYIQAHLEPGKTILVYPYLPLYYYLTETHAPVGYDYFQPGMNTPQQAQEIIASLQSQNVHGVLFEPWFADKFANSWPGTPLSAITKDPVADYIAQNYRVCRILNSVSDWRFQFMVRKEVACP